MCIQFNSVGLLGIACLRNERCVAGLEILNSFPNVTRLGKVETKLKLNSLTVPGMFRLHLLFRFRY